jgi:hypothetical protein
MLSPEKETKLYQIFIAVDDFCLRLDGWKQSQPERFPPREWDKPLMSESEMSESEMSESEMSESEMSESEMSESELMSICIFYHYSGYKCCQYYYQQITDFEKLFSQANQL